MLRRLRLLTAGESHGPAITAVLEGMPAGLELPPGYVDEQLRRRQQGYGRGGRQRIEQDRVRWLGGLRFGRTLGSPLAMLIENRDFANWAEEMAPEGPEVRRRQVRVPRPGHADYAGGLKYRARDLRDVLERASARETAARVAAGAVARRLLEELGIELCSRVVAIGGVQDTSSVAGLSIAEIRERTEASSVRALGAEASAAMVARIERAQREGDSVGGVFEVRARGVVPGLGSHVQWDRRLDALLVGALCSIQAVKAAAVGEGIELAAAPGSQAHDAFALPAEGGPPRRTTNRAGGIEGGMTNGEDVVVRGWMKPLSTLPRPLPSFDWLRGEPAAAHRERTDSCAVPAAAVVGEAMVALVLADALLDKLGGDSMDELRERLALLWREPPPFAGRTAS
ncbi:MAG: chorismate synthase [Planctomycetota bacterium]|nr:MAG: chorismate synthase [Planctomycetota bacterium]